MTRRLSSAASSAAWMTALFLSLSLQACATRFQIPSPVPPPIREHAIVAPLESAWESSLRALTALGFVPAEIDPGQRIIVSEFRLVEGNADRDRRRGVAGVAVERDVYSAGRERLLVNMTPLDADRTQVRLVAEVQAKIERRGEIQYGGVAGERSPLPLFTAWSTKTEATDPEWDTLTSNGILEDQFLAALVTELTKTNAAGQ